MKKAYVKPEVYFESFELSASIATTCPKETHLPTAGICGVYVPGAGVAFVTGITGCEYTDNVSDGDFGVCYHNPNSTQSLFNSQ